MPRNLTEFGMLVLSRPARAHERLIRMFQQYGTREGVAEQLGVSPDTVRRWIATLDRAGFADPRIAASDGGAKVRRPYRRG